MKVIDRYIAKTVVVDTLFVLLALILLRSLFGFMDESNQVGRGEYQLIDALYFTILQAPIRIYDFFPVSALIGGLLGMGRMASHSEMIIMRSSGISLHAISLSVLKGTVSLMVMVILIGEFIAPKSSQLGWQMQTSLISGGNLVKSSQGVWVKENNSYVHIRRILPDGQLEGVTRFQFAEQQLQAMIYAHNATYQNDRWMLDDVRQTFISEDSVHSTEADTMYWESTISPDTLGIVSLKPENLNIIGLVEYNQYLDENGLNSTRYKLAFWKKIIQPFSVVVMMFLALSFISGPLRTVTVGARIVLGIVVGFAFNMLSNIFGPVSLIYNMPPFLAAMLPTLAFAFVATYMMKKAR